MTKYVKCNCCNKRVYFGERVYRFKGYLGVYCSAQCFAETHCVVTDLNEELADNSCCTVYDDDQRRTELKEQMERLLREMNECKEEYESLHNNTK